MTWLLFVTIMAATMPSQGSKGRSVGDMLPLLKRHEIQVLLGAGFTPTDVARRTGTSIDTVGRVRREDAVEHTDDRAERSDRKIGRPSKAAPFSRDALRRRGRASSRHSPQSRGPRCKAPVSSHRRRVRLHLPVDVPADDDRVALAPDFVTEGRSVIFEGRPGRGKTHLAIAIAYRAMQNGFDALFTTAAELIETLSSASRAGGMREALAEYLRPHVLVVDEVGYLACSDDAANVLYHVVNDRHIRRRAMIFTTNKHPKRWGAALHDDDLAEAIVDRILERGRLLRLDGPSVRTNHLPGDEFADDDQTDPRSRKVSGTNAAEFPESTAALSVVNVMSSDSSRGPEDPE